MLICSLLLMAGVHLYRNSSATTDENWFRISPGRLYVTTSFPGYLIEAIDAKRPPGFGTTMTLDSVWVGDLLVALNRQKLFEVTPLKEILSRVARDSALHLTFFRPLTSQFLDYKVPAIVLSENFFRSIPTTVHIIEVIPGGASDQAGMKRGDLISHIDGQSFKTANEADRIMRRAHAGKVIDYRVIRANHELVLSVTLARLGIQLIDLSVFLLGLVYLGLGAFIAFKRPQIPAARLLGLALILIGFFFAVLINNLPINYDSFALIRLVTATISLFLGIVLWIQARFLFPQELSGLAHQRRFIIILWTMLVVVLALYFSSLFTPALNFFWLGSFAADFILFGGIILLFIYSAILQLYFRKAKSIEFKRSNRWLGFAEIIAGIASLLLGFDMAFKGITINVWLFILPFLLVPLVYLSTIGRYRLMDISLRISRSIQYSILIWCWNIVLIGISVFLLFVLANLDLRLPRFHFYGSVIQVYEQVSPLRGNTFQDKVALIILTMGFLVLIWRIGTIGQQFIEKKFHRSRYDYRRAASELADVMATRLKLAELAQGIVKELAELMQLKRVSVFFYRDEKICCCQEAYGFKSNIWNELCQSIEPRFLQILQQHRSDSLFSVDYLPSAIKMALVSQQIQFIVPIRSRDRLVGSLLIGEKLSEAAFHQEDLAFLSAVTKQASIAIENAFLYEKLAEQERLKYELEIARRIQMASLPQKTPQISGLDISGISIPASEVGGDYFDYLNGVSDSLTVIVGDVSGKGTSAALYMSKIQGILRSLHDFGLSPRELFVRANRLLSHDLEKTYFITAIGAAFDSVHKKVKIARAGHLPLFLYRNSNQTVEKVTPRGVGMGLDKAGNFDVALEEKVIDFQAGDVFLFVTDGVTEAQSKSGAEYGEDRLVNLLTRYAHSDAGQIRAQVVTEVGNFVEDKSYHDDLTVVVVKVNLNEA